MQYHDGSEILLGDRVLLPVPEGKALARVVMLGDTRAHLALESKFLEWVNSTDVLSSSSVLVEWVTRNPFEHNDPALAPVGNYMFTVIDECVEFQTRAEA